MRASSSSAASQPLRLPSKAGKRSRNSRSPVHRVPVRASYTVRSQSVCAFGHARNANGRPPRSRSRSCSTSRSGPMICAPAGGESISPGYSLTKKSLLRAMASASAACPTKLRRVVLECGIAEHVIHVHVGVDDVADRQGGVCCDRRAQLASDADRAAGIDDGHAFLADDEADDWRCRHGPAHPAPAAVRDARRPRARVRSD